MQTMSNNVKWKEETKWICVMKTVKYDGKTIWSYASAGVAWTQGYARTALAAFCTKIGIEASTINVILGIIVGVSSAYAVYKLGTASYF